MKNFLISIKIVDVSTQYNMMAKKTRRYRFFSFVSSCQVDRSHYKMVKSLIECMPTMFVCIVIAVVVFEFMEIKSLYWFHSWKKKKKKIKDSEIVCVSFFFSSFICFYFSNWIEFEEDCQCFILLTARNDNDDHQWPNDQSIHRSLVFFFLFYLY